MVQLDIPRGGAKPVIPYTTMGYIFHFDETRTSIRRLCASRMMLCSRLAALRTPLTAARPSPIMRTATASATCAATHACGYREGREENERGTPYSALGELHTLDDNECLSYSGASDWHTPTCMYMYT